MCCQETGSSDGTTCQLLYHDFLLLSVTVKALLEIKVLNRALACHCLSHTFHKVEINTATETPAQTAGIKNKNL